MTFTFSAWMKDQTTRDDGVGEFCRAVMELPRRPRGNAGFDVWYRWVHRYTEDPEIVDRYFEVWREFAYGYDARYDRRRIVRVNGRC